MGVRRGWAAALLVAGLVLLGGPAAAQEQDPCAPGPDGAVPEMCQSGPAEPAPAEEDPCAPGPDGSVPEMCQGAPAPTDSSSCAPQPVEPGDGVVTDGDTPVSSEDPPASAEPQPEETVATPAPGTAAEDDGVVCAFGAPEPAVVSAPQEAAPAVAPVSRLPRTGSQDRLLALVALGSALVVLGAGTAAAARRR